MSSTRLRIASIWLAAVLLVVPAFAEVVIVTASGERLLVAGDDPAPAAEISPRRSGGFGSLHRDAAVESPTGGMSPSEIWVFPWTVDDTTAAGNSTLFSIRHQEESPGPIVVSIDYFDTRFNLVTTRNIQLAPNQVVPINVRSIGELVDPGGVRRGIGQIEAPEDVSVDFFEVDFDQNFAFGSLGAEMDDFCAVFTSRFLQFPGTTGGTELTVLVNGPQGNDPDVNPPTLTVEVFTQAGNPITTFDLFTDDWLFSFDPELVIGDVSFGSMRISINALLSPAGIILERHSAFSRFSVGLPSYCLEEELLF